MFDLHYAAQPHQVWPQFTHNKGEEVNAPLKTKMTTVPSPRGGLDLINLQRKGKCNTLRTKNPNPAVSPMCGLV